MLSHDGSMNARRGNKDNPKRAALRPPMDRRHIERFHDALSRMMADQNFKSAAEANAFLEKQVDAGALDWDSLGPGPAATPLQQAQELFYQALDAGSRGKRVKMARQALALCEECADAWLLLAEEEAITRSDREKYVTRALEAAERLLGPKGFEEYRGHFWSFHETRPYMRARQALAEVLAENGKLEEAVAHWEAMLDLNLNDNQGIRMELLRAYLERNEQEKAAALFRRYPDDGSCEMLYGRVILHVARGDEKAARKSLSQASKINAHVPQFLLGRRPLPRKLPELITWGGEDEAGAYAVDYWRLWQKTPGALELLKSATAATSGHHPAKQL